ncbi:MAG: hypothetical protein VX392_07870 [Verrucomicrobiota bacterium]|nr:hypothetical protein [Verrucomicrobiota bacterium]
MTMTLMGQIGWFNNEGEIGGSADCIIQNLVNYTATGFASTFAPNPVLTDRTN